MTWTPLSQKLTTGAVALGALLSGAPCATATETASPLATASAPAPRGIDEKFEELKKSLGSSYDEDRTEDYKRLLSGVISVGTIKLIPAQFVGTYGRALADKSPELVTHVIATASRFGPENAWHAPSTWFDVLDGL